MQLRYTVVAAFIENTALGMFMDVIFKRGLTTLKKKKKKKPDESIVAFLKHGLSPTHKNVA